MNADVFIYMVICAGVLIFLTIGEIVFEFFCFLINWLKNNKRRR